MSSSRVFNNKMNENYHRDYIKQSHTHSSSTSTATADDEDFINMDGSSSFQTSTNSPNKAPGTHQGPDISGLKFYSQSENASNKTHANFFRKSIVVSPSWREIKSHHEVTASTNGVVEDSNLSFDNEVPTRNLELVISPSLQQLSDILTSKVNHSQTQMTPLLENPDEIDVDSGITGTLGFNRNQSVATFYTARTLNTVASDETYQLSRNISASETPDLIDLSSPVVEESKQWHKEDTPAALFEHDRPAHGNGEMSSSTIDNAGPLSNSSKQSQEYNYTDIYEHYSPEKNLSTNSDSDYQLPENSQDHINNRNSVLSEQFTLRNIQTPQFGNIFETNDSVHEFGYEREDSGFSDFSFVPSAKTNKVTYNTATLESPFVQSNNNRYSMRIVEDDAEEIFSDDASKDDHLSFGLTPAINNTTNEFDSIPKLLPSVEENENSVSSPLSSPLLISPMNPPSPTMEQYKKTSNQQQELHSEKTTLQQHRTESKPQTAAKLDEQNSNPVVDTVKTKKGRLTFKGLFKKDERKSEPKARSNRPTSFSFGTLENENNKKLPVSERKEKSMSLLSNWKRRSIFSSNTNIAKKEKTNSIQINSSTQTPPSPKKSRTMSFSSLGKLSPRRSSPHKHSHSAPLVSVDLSKNLPNLPPEKQASEPLLAAYGLDSTPVLGQSFPVNYEKGTPELVTNSNASPAFDQVPQISKATSLQRIQTASTENMQEAQSAILDYVPSEKEELESMEKVVDLSFNTTYASYSNSHDLSAEQNSSSIYETTSSPLVRPPVIHVPSPKTPASERTKIYNTSTTPIGSPSTIREKSPASLTLASFTASPNRFHIGDDLFPKHLGIDEIESIVTLERSRSMKSVRSGKVNKTSSIHSNKGSKKSISQLMQDHNSDFDELLLPDGSVLVKNSSFSYDDFEAESKQIKSLKPQVSSPLATKYTGHQDVIVTGNGDTEEDNFEELQDLINMINFDSNEDVFDTNFDIDMNFNIELSPLKKTNDLVDTEETKERQTSLQSFTSKNMNHELSKDVSVPDFLANDSAFDIDFGDLDTLEAFDSPSVSKVSLKRPTVEYIASNDQLPAVERQRQVSRESVEEIIRKEEDYTQSCGIESAGNVEESTPNAYFPEYDTRPTSLSFKGLKGPSFNNTLKPATQNAILGSVSLLQPVGAIVPSDSENSFGHYQYDNYSDVFDETKSMKKESQDDPVTIIPIQEVSKNPFTTHYTQSYDDLAAMRPDSSEKTNRFMQKLSNNEFGHFSTASLPASIGSPNDTEKIEKSKKLLRKKNKSISSFGKIFGVKEDRVKFSSRILLYETYGEDEYDREPDVATCNNLTPKLAMEIKAELNDLKSSMPIHESSKCYTHFF